MKLKLCLAGLACLFLGSAWAQPDDELTEKEKAYRDSIAALNAENEQNAVSREAYNAGIQLFENKKYDAAISKFGEAIKLDPEFKDAYYNKGVAENESGKFKGAVKTFTTLIGKEKTGKALFQRARAHQGLMDYAKAEEDYDEALKVDPSNEKVPYNYGTLKFLQKDYDGAIKMFSKAISIKNDFAFAYNDRGSAYRMKKEYQKAIADYELAAKHNPNLPFVLNNIGTVHKKTKNYAAAIAAYNRAISIDANYYLAYNNRGSVLFDQGKYNDARKDFDKAINLNGKYAPAYNNRGAVKFKNEDYDGAVEDYNMAIKLNKDYAHAYVNRGIAKERLRDAIGACEDWAKARELGSDIAKTYQSETCQ